MPHYLPGKAADCGVTAKDNRRFLEGVLWIARAGSPWRDLPPEYGHWHRVYVRYNLWSHKGIWQQVFEAATIIEKAYCKTPEEQAVRDKSVSKIRNAKSLLLKVINQTERRVIKKENVPCAEKVTFF